MRISRIKVSSETVGTVRTGFSGAKTVLAEESGRFEIRFFSSNGRLKDVVQVEKGAEYVVGPDFVKRQVPLEEDNYWPRRWAREFKRVAHKSYFVLLREGEEYLIAGNGKKEIKWKCPTSLERLVWTPQGGGFPCQKCFVNRSWLERVGYEEFCKEMESAKAFSMNLQMERYWR
jgi:hypothetical protein